MKIKRKKLTVTLACFLAATFAWGQSTPVIGPRAEDSIMIKEQAADDADEAGWGQIWIKNDTPNILNFTDDAGTTVQLGIGAASGSDHGGLTGLADDDHTMYYKIDGSRALTASIEFESDDPGLTFDDTDVGDDTWQLGFVAGAFRLRNTTQGINPILITEDAETLTTLSDIVVQNAIPYIKFDSVNDWTIVWSSGEFIIADATTAENVIRITDATHDVLFSDGVQISDGEFVGTGPAVGRIEFDDDTVDKVIVLGAAFEVGNGVPGDATVAESAYVEGILEVDGVLHADGVIEAAGDINAAGDVIMAEDNVVGIGAALERILFDGSNDEIEFLSAQVIIGNGTPGYATAVEALYVEGNIETDADIDMPAASDIRMGGTAMFTESGGTVIFGGTKLDLGANDMDVNDLQVDGTLVVVGQMTGNPPGGVVTYHDDGSSTQFKPAADNDAARATALNAAITASGATDFSFIYPGTYLGSSLIGVKTLRGAWRGAGRKSVLIDGTGATIDEAWVLDDGASLSDVGFVNMDDAGSGFTLSPQGDNDTVIIERVDMTSDAVNGIINCYYVGAGIDGTTAYIRDCNWETTLHGIDILGLNTTIHIYDSVITSDESNAGGGARCLFLTSTTTGSKIYSYDSEYYGTGSSSADGLIYFDGADTACEIRMWGGRIVPGSAATAVEIDTGASLGVCNLVWVDFDTTDIAEDVTGVLKFNYIIDYTYVNAGAMIPFTTSGAEAETLNYTSTGDDIEVDTMAYDTGAEEGSGFWITFPEGWDAGTVQAKFHWTSTAGSIAQGVKWDIAAQAYGDSAAIDQALGTEQTVTDALLALNDMHISGSLGTALTIADAASGLPIWFETTRDYADGGDTITDDAHLIGITIEFARSIHTTKVY